MQGTPPSEIACDEVLEAKIAEVLEVHGIHTVADLLACSPRTLLKIFDQKNYYGREYLKRVNSLIEHVRKYGGTIGTVDDAALFERVFADDTHLHCVLRRRLVPVSFVINARRPEDLCVIDQIGPILAKKILSRRSEMLSYIEAEAVYGSRGFLGM